MKILALLFITTLLNLSSLIAHSKGSVRLSELQILGENYPKFLNFRSGEYALRSGIYVVDSTFKSVIGSNGRKVKLKKVNSDKFTNDIKLYQAIIGKSESEEVDNKLGEVYNAFSQFKVQNPDKGLLLHFNGRCRKPFYQEKGSGSFFAGHYLYRKAMLGVSNIDSDREVLTIELDKLNSNILKYKKVKKAQVFFTLIPLKNGINDYCNGEFLELISFDSTANSVRVRRLNFDSQINKSHKKGEYKLAQPYVVADRFIYNFALNSPKDSLGRNCASALAQRLSNIFKNDKNYRNWDGIVLDAPVINSAMADGDLCDVDMDGVVDRDGFYCGIATQLEGYNHFLKELRTNLGDDFIIVADNRVVRHQRGFKYLNGIESEGWPQKKDNIYFKSWSSAIARHQFINKRVLAPSLHFFNCAEPANYASSRLIEVAAAATGAATTAHYRKDLASNESVGISDEQRKGVEKNYSGWLGKPLSSMIHLAEKTCNLIYESNQTINFRPANSKSVIGLPQSALALRNIDNISGQLSIRVDIVASEMAGYDDGMARNCTVTISPSDNSEFNHKILKRRDFRESKEAPAYQQNFYVDSSECSVLLYFRWLSGDKVDLNFEIEGVEKAQINAIKVYNAPDVIYREFENGIVLGNPSLEKVKIDLEELVPTAKLRRINGLYDKRINNGKDLKKSVTIEPLDGLFIEKF